MKNKSKCLMFSKYILLNKENISLMLYVLNKDKTLLLVIKTYTGKGSH